ncbi:magnesium-dependent phosphatase 1-like [Bradysia coprophila]|uniref:magnesium-dependent phosphatase 1-like n=1 Tax=Bradysia coprophila TaxID=38358 RepID=UPI00187DCD25|nr:magnesium-dependent phosphatase 1-like [Bradysia coprophila]
MSSTYFDKKIDGLDLIVFDLDYTLWPFYVEYCDKPFKKTETDILDASGNQVKPYPHSTNILQKLSSLGYKIGIASRTSAVKDAAELVNSFEWTQYISYQEIYPTCKVQHFNQFNKQSGIPFERMLFFDDEEHNVADINGIGAVAILVDSGVSDSVVADGLEYFVRKQIIGK